MKTEKEIRAHRDDLRKCILTRCDCTGTPNEFACFMGGQMMEAMNTVLSWVLEENPDMDKTVEDTAAGARR